MKNVVLLLGFVLAVSVFVHPQGLGSIAGTVTDPQGALVASAQVTATEVGTGISRSTTTDAQGHFLFNSMRPTEYSVTVDAPGFRKFTQTSLTLLADQALTLNAKLVVGNPTEVVEVTGNVLAVDTSTPTIKQVIEQQRISELPLNGRNAATLTLLVPGAVNSPNGGADQGATKTFPSAVTYSVNGARQNTISYQLDGGNYIDEYTNVNQPFPFPDNLQEFSVQTTNYSAQYGENAGGVVNVVTKSGTNSFHGDLFEYVRNPAFNAQNFFATPTAQDSVKRNQYGGTIGGPIIRNRTYFFAGYQRTEFRNLALGSQKVPGQADITSFLTKGPFGTPGVIDPAIASMMGIIPGCNVVGCGPAFNASAGQLDPNAKFSLTGGTIPAAANSAFSFSKPDSESFDSGMGKIDHTIGKNDNLTLRYEFDRFIKKPVFNPVLLVAYTDATFDITAQNALIHESHIFSPHFINDARFSYSREIANRGPSPTAVNVTAFGVPLPFNPKPNAIQGVGVQGGFTFGDNPQAAFVRNNFAWSDDISYEMGKHDLHFGGSIERSRVDLNNQFNQPGIFGFGNQDVYLFKDPVTKKPITFPTYSLFLAGILSDGSGAGNGYALQQGSGEFKQNRDWFVGLYLQDNYRLTPRLTLNLGVRWEPALPWSDNGNRWAQVNLTAMAQGIRSRVYPNAPPGIFFSGQNGIPSDPGMPKNALRASLGNFAPRIGFAWDVFGDGKTSLRGGGGIFYDSRVMGMLSNRFVDEWPFSPQFILSTAAVSNPGPGTSPGFFSDPLCQLSGTQTSLNCNGTQKSFYPTFPSPFPAPTNFPYSPPFNQIAVSYDPSGNYKVPTIYEWNLTIERQLRWNMLARAAYVGSQSRHILETLFYNFSNPGFGSFQQPFNPICGASTGLANCTVFAGSNKTFTQSTFSPTVQANVTDVSGNYNALQLSMEKRVSHGLTVLGNYTWSRSLDDLPFGMGVSGFDGSYSPLPFTDPNRHHFDYGPSGFDRTHVFTASYVWQLPGAGKGWMNTVLGGWEWGGIFSAASGRPITVLQGSNVSNIGTGQDRGTLVSGVDPYSSTACVGVTVACKSWLNPAAFLTTTQVNAQFAPATGGTGTVGNVSKNFLRLPNTWDMDMSASKYFNITERWKLQFRVEYFNIFNHPNFAPESTSSGTVNGTDQISAFDKINGNSAFGTFRAGQAADPRVAQFALKLHF
jgi:outer membrane receptor protein involved in Fe transport